MTRWAGSGGAGGGVTLTTSACSALEGEVTRWAGSGGAGGGVTHHVSVLGAGGGGDAVGRVRRGGGRGDSPRQRARRWRGR